MEKVNLKVDSANNSPVLIPPAFWCLVASNEVFVGYDALCGHFEGHVILWIGPYLGL